MPGANGLWFGWSGKTCESGCDPQCSTFGSLTYAVCDLSRLDAERYYCGFANRTLWPICQYRLDLARTVGMQRGRLFPGTSA
jgi:trehalose 6-phosphate synthase